MNPLFLLIVIPRLEEIDSVLGDAIDEAMLLGDAAAPAAGQLVLERLRLADAREGVGEDSGHQVKDSERGFAVRLDPVP